MTSLTSHTNESDARLAIVAGYGRLPIDVAVAAREMGIDPFIIAIRGEADQDWGDFDHAYLPIANAVKVVKTMRQHNVNRIVFAGGVRNRPKVTDVRITFRLLFSLPKLLKVIRAGGDDALLRTTINLFEIHGVTVLGAQEIAPNLLAQEGVLGKIGISEQNKADIKAASSAALKLGIADKGQAAVSVNGTVVAIEGPDGTDAMLKALADNSGVNPTAEQQTDLASNQGVLVKLCKPQQDKRADLPTIGPTSVINAHKAGLSGIAVEAGRSFILDKENVIKEADKYGMFIVGITREAAK
ncbi:MAG: UDP-2,3-diacylglucosamine diphosphatase LpxI [Lentilitoribacter sp.]